MFRLIAKLLDVGTKARIDSIQRNAKNRFQYCADKNLFSFFTKPASNKKKHMYKKCKKSSKCVNFTNKKGEKQH